MEVYLNHTNMRSITTWDHFKEATPQDIEHFFTWVWRESILHGTISKAESIMIRDYKREEAMVTTYGNITQLQSVTTIDFSYWTPKTPDGYGNWMRMEITRRPGTSSMRIEREMNPVELDEESYAMG